MARASTALAQEKTFDLKISHWVPPSHPLQKALEEWGASVEKESGGTIHYKVYPSQQLGKAFDHYDMARDGIADLTYINPGYQPGRFPIIAAGELPFLMSNGKGGTVALDEWYRKYAAKEMKDVKFCLAFVHDPGAHPLGRQEGHGARRHQGHEDPPGAGHHRRIRAAPRRHQRAGFGAGSARRAWRVTSPTRVTFPWGSIMLFGIDKVTKYHMELPLYTTTFALVFNKAKYDAMDAKQKKVIDDHCTSEWALKVAAPWADFEHNGIAKIKAEAGQDVYDITPAQARRMAQGGRAARGQMGRGRQEGRRRSGHGARPS